MFIDANIFIYHFTGFSSSCHGFLKRCSSGALRGITSLSVLLEVAHRLMIIEAQQKRLIRGPNPAQKLAHSPSIIKRLHLYADWTLAIPRMGIEVEEVPFQDLVSSISVRQRSGLLTLDALIVAMMIRLKISNLATADLGFENVKEIKLFKPDDLEK